MRKKFVLVTGATGFVGRHLVHHLRSNAFDVREGVWSGSPGFDSSRHFTVEAGCDMAPALDAVDAVIHAAGVAHRPSKARRRAGATVELGNTQLTADLVRAVRRSRVGLFVHLSSIAAFGIPDGSTLITGLREGDDREHCSEYGRSKRAAEACVASLLEHGVVGLNLRPPLIYGRGARGNWPLFCRLIESGVPLPFQSIDNRRSYLGIDNLCDLITTLVDREPDPSTGGCYHVADAGTVSLSKVVAHLRESIGIGPRQFRLPANFMETVLAIVGRREMASGLFGNLVVDSTLLQRTFGWSPPFPTLESMARSLRSTRGEP